MSTGLTDRVPGATPTFTDRLIQAVEEKRSQIVVGLDPRVDLLPVELRGDAHVGPATSALAVERFCKSVIDAVAPNVIAVKPQLAFFESLGHHGIKALEEVAAYARSADLLVLLDGKRGDIGSTARAYAEAYLEAPDGETPLGDALTINPYLGGDSIEPFVAAIRRSGGGVFCLVKTSNAGSSDLQDIELSDGRPLWHHVAELVEQWGEGSVGTDGLSNVGAVVGATYPRAVAEARRLLPRSVLLLPGVGAQGASAGDVARAFTSGPASALVAASRTIIYSYRTSGESDWRASIAQASAALRGEVWTASGW